MQLRYLTRFADMNDIPVFSDVDEVIKAYENAVSIAQFSTGDVIPEDIDLTPFDRVEGFTLVYIHSYVYIINNRKVIAIFSSVDKKTIFQVDLEELRSAHNCYSFLYNDKNYIVIERNTFSDGYKKCTCCGKWISIEKETCEECVRIGMEYCKDCGKPIRKGEEIYYEDEIYCNNCMRECDDCGKLVPKSTMIYDYYCESCSEHYYECEECGRVEHVDDTVAIDDSVYCLDCVTYCKNCGKYFLNGDVTEFNGEYYCNDCLDDITRICDDCGARIWADDANWEGDYCYCDSCIDDHNHDNRVRDYHDNPYREFHRMPENDGYHDNFIGCEIETECGNYDERVDITDEYGEDEKYIYQMKDGSLEDDGIECITQPMTKAFFDNFNFEDWMNALTDAGARSHGTSNCGLHIHLSNQWFHYDSEEIAFLVGKCRLFFANNKPCCERFARRSANRFCEYIKPYEECLYSSADEEKDKVKNFGKSSGRYTSCHITGKGTVEFRVFKGTLNPETFRASVEFCIRLVDFVKTNEPLTWKRFIEYKEIPNILKSYLERRELLCA